MTMLPGCGRLASKVRFDERDTLTPEVAPGGEIVAVERPSGGAPVELSNRGLLADVRHIHATELPLAALVMAAQRQRPAPGLIHHSDRGSQYAAGAYVDHLTAIGATPSMSRTGNCYDNAPMESFFHTLKVELVHQCSWTTHVEARQALFAYITPNALGTRISKPSFFRRLTNGFTSAGGARRSVIRHRS